MPAGVPLTHDQKLAIVRMYDDEGQTQPQIGHALGITSSAVSRVLRANGIATRTGKQAPGLAQPSDVEVAYAAALFEGEGTVGAHGGRGHPRMRIEMVDREPLERDLGILGGLLSGPHPKPPPCQPQHKWVLNGWTRVEDAYALIGPWLCPRRVAQFERALAKAPPVDHRGQWGWSRHRVVAADATA